MKKLFYLLTIFLLLFLTVNSCSDSGTESTPIYSLSVTADPAEAGSVSPSSGEYEQGQSIEITANPNDGWMFDGWQGGHTGSGNPASVMMNSDKQITARFVERTYPLTVNKEGEGTVQERVISQKTTDYEEGTVVELTAEPSDGWRFVEWQGDLEGSENPVTIEIDEEKNVTAVFERRDYPLTVNIEGEGTVAEEVIQAKTTDYPYETNVQLTATATEGWVFARWEGDVTGNENPATIEVINEKTVTAVFERDYFPLELLTEGEGTVEAALATGNQNEEGLFEFGSTVELSAMASTGWQFTGWSGLAEGAENPTTIEIGTDNTVTASFERQEYSLTVTTDGGGSVAESLLSGTETEAGYLYDSQVELTATADEGWEFVGWSGDLSRSDNPATLTIDSNKNITALFSKLSFSINTYVDGEGAIEIMPQSKNYEYGDEIEVTAIPSTGYHFIRWLGDLSGTDNPNIVGVDKNLDFGAQFKTIEEALVYRKGGGVYINDRVHSATLQLYNTLPQDAELLRVTLKNQNGITVTENIDGVIITSGSGISFNVSFGIQPTIEIFNSYTVEWEVVYDGETVVKSNLVGNPESFKLPPNIGFTTIESTVN